MSQVRRLPKRVRPVAVHVEDGHEVSRWRHHWNDYKVSYHCFFYRVVVVAKERSGGARVSELRRGRGQVFLGLPHFSPISDLVVLEQAMCPGKAWTSGTSWVFLCDAAAPHTPLPKGILRHPCVPW